MRAPRRLAFLVLAGLLVAAAATADEIKVVTSGAFTAAYLELVPQFERATGHKVVTAFGPSMGSSRQLRPSVLVNTRAVASGLGELAPTATNRPSWAATDSRSP